MSRCRAPEVLSLSLILGAAIVAFQSSVNAQPQTRYNIIRQTMTSGATAVPKPAQLEFQAAPSSQTQPISTPSVEANDPTLPTIPISGNTGQPGQYVSNQPYAPADETSYSGMAGRYVVYVDSNDPITLQQVKTSVEPGAFFKTIGGRTVIQTGSFNNYTSVEQQIASLQAAGFTNAKYEPLDGSSGGPFIPVDPTYPPTDPQYPTGPGTPGPVRPGILRPSIPYGATAYYVVVPGGAEQLPSLQRRVIQLGADLSVVQQRVAPRGPHIAIGPFSNRGDAETWTSYFRDYGLDARVYYGR